MQYVDYREVIQETFKVVNKDGETVPFIFNDTQNFAYNLMQQDHPDFRGIRENWLKSRQWGGSTMITAMFAVDFIFSELGEMPLTNSDVYSHKDDETSTHFNRFSFFYDCWISKAYETENPKDISKIRKLLLKSDETGDKMVGNRGSEFTTQTASAKVSGRGGTRQNLLFTEIAFYPNTEIINAKTLVSGAEKQVKPGSGKIIRESSGNLSGDYFQKEYDNGKLAGARYKSRFFGWYLHKEYQLPAPTDWQPSKYYDQIRSEHDVSIDQCYWHHVTTRDQRNHEEFDLEELREYPTYDVEAFLLSGNPYFSKEALVYYTGLIRQPLAVGSTLSEVYGRI